MNGIQGKKKLQSVQDVKALTGTEIERNDFYVYVYLDPRKPGKYKYGKYKFDYEPFYVGRGQKTRDTDFAQHTKFVRDKIKGILKTRKPIFVKRIHPNLNFTASLQKEIEAIKQIGRLDLKVGPLCNLTSGGDGIRGRIATPHTEETKRKMSLAQKGRVFSEGTKQKMRESRKNILTKEYRANLSEKLKMFNAQSTKEERRNPKRSRPGVTNPFYGKHHSEEARGKISSANKGRIGTFLGRKHTNETKEKISLANKGHIVSKEHKQKISSALKGRVFSAEHSRKKSEAQTGSKNHRYGVKTSEETRLKISLKLKGANNPMYGKSALRGVSPSEETRERISKALKGRVFTEEWKQKISATKKKQKRKMSDEGKRRMSERLKGRKFTDEHRRKISETLKKYKRTPEHCANISKAKRKEFI